MKRRHPEVDFTFRKWDGSAHWVHPSTVLGTDDCGLWLGQVHGWVSRRPGKEFTPRTMTVSVLPDAGGWVATFFPQDEAGVGVYVDIVADLDPGALTGIDMDLDVVRRDGKTWIDDEDEFEAHRVSMGYPDDVVRRCRADADLVLRMLRESAAPFDGRASSWLQRLRITTPL